MNCLFFVWSKGNNKKVCNNIIKSKKLQNGYNICKFILTSHRHRSVLSLANKVSLKEGENILHYLSIYMEKYIFRPNQHLSNKGIKQKMNYRRTVLIGYWAYSTAYYDVASATEDWLYLLD